MPATVDYFIYAQTALAAYASSLALGRGGNAAAYEDADMSPIQARRFDDTWEVLGQQELGDGFSAVLLQEVDAVGHPVGQKVLAIRGSEGSNWGIDYRGADLIDVLLLGTAAGSSQYNSLQSFYLSLIGQGKLGAVENIVVTGHSLGGFLAQAFAAKHLAVSAAYTYNAPGFSVAPYIVSNLGTELLKLFGLSGTIPNDKIVNIRALDGISGTASLGQMIGSVQAVKIETGGAFHNHSIVTLTDALALYKLYAELSPALSIEQISNAFRSASEQDVFTLERSLDALRVYFEGETAQGSGQAPSENRDELYSKLYSLQESAGYRAMAGSAAVRVTAELSAAALSAQAKQDFGYFMAVRYLLPIAIEGTSSAVIAANSDLYGRWQADRAKRIGSAADLEFTDAYLTDRAAMLAYTNTARTHDNLTIASSTIAGATEYFDQASDLRVRAYNPAAGEFRKVYFGGDGPDSLTGGGQADRLYGGDGDDILAGGDSGDYLEGGADNDTLDGGAGTNTLKGGKDFDTYVVRSGEGVQHISDSDGLGQIVFDGVPLTDGSLADGTRYVSADGGVQLSFTGDLIAGGALSINNAITVHDFHNGDLGITLSGATAPPTPPVTVYSYIGTGFPAGGPETSDFLGGSDFNDLFVSVNPDPSKWNYFIYEGRAGDDSFRGNARDLDMFFGDAGSDYIDGGAIVDSIGPAEGDFLNGGAGQDLIFGGDGDDQIYGDAVGGYVSRSSTTGEIIRAQVGPLWWSSYSGYWNLEPVRANWEGDPIDRYFFNSVPDAVKYALGITPQTDLSTLYDDTLDGGGGSDSIFGGNGSDRILGGSGNDWLTGDGDNWQGSSMDYSSFGELAVLFGKPGDDLLDGGDGNDILADQVGGSDALYGGSGNDNLFNRDQNVYGYTTDATFSNYLDGGDGNDYIFSINSNGFDVLVGGNGDDEIKFKGLGAAIDGGADDDTITITFDNVVGSSGEFTLLGGSGNDRILFLSDNGQDFIDGGDGNDHLEGSDVHGGSGDDIVLGTAGDDVLVGDDDNDILAGRGALNAYHGGVGFLEWSSIYDAEEEEDIFFSQPGGIGFFAFPGETYGEDWLFGGQGDDTYIFTLGAGVAHIVDEAGFNHIDLQSYEIQDPRPFGDNVMQVITKDSIHFELRDGETRLVYGDVGDSIGLGESIGDTIQGVTLTHITEELRFDGSHDEPQPFFLYATEEVTLDLPVFQIGTSGDDVLVAMDGVTNSLEGWKGNDILVGGAGDDTFVFNIGDGVDQIEDIALPGAGNTLQFGAGITQDMLALSLGSLMIKVGTGGDAVHLDTCDSNNVLGMHSVETFRFADGTSLSYGELISRGFDLTGSDGEDVIIGTDVADRIDGKGGNDILMGGAGSDTYVFGLGSGRDLIHEASVASDTDTLRLLVDPDDVTVTRDANSFVVSLNGTSDQIAIDWFTDASARIERVTFADGTVWDASTLENQVGSQTNLAPVVANGISDQITQEDVLFSFVVPPGTFFDPDEGDMVTVLATQADGSSLPGWLRFDSATQTFSGTPLNADVGTLSLKVTATDGASASVSDSFDVTVANTNDAPTVANAIADQTVAEDSAFSYRVAANTFADEDVGDSLRYSATQANGDALPTWLSFDAATRTFSGTPDVADIGAWPVAVTATDAHGAAVTTAFNLAVQSQFGAKVKGSKTDNILYGNSGNETLKGRDGNDALFGFAGDDRLRGDKGNDLLQGGAGADILRAGKGQNLLDGGAGDDVIKGGKGAELIAGGTGNDIIRTGKGQDVIAFNRGDGSDLLYSEHKSDNTLSFGGGIGYEDLSLARQGKDLIVDAGQGDRVVLKGWYSGHDSVLNLQIIIDATAAFDANSSDPLLNRRVQTFDFVGLVNAFDQAMAQSPGLTSWAMTNALLEFQLSGMDSMALGGDLAYWYGKNGGFAGISVAAAQQVIGAPGFGQDAQNLRPFSGLQEGMVKLA